MDQMSFFGGELTKPIVNVASVPQRSPFRYPGGKTWLIPRIRRWLGSMPQRPAHFIEPFAGGGSVSLAVAFERMADYITMVEIDPQVASVWHTIIHGDAEALATRIVGFPFTAEHVADLLAAPHTSAADLAFQTIIKNRANHGGILADGAGRIKLGENGKGIASRWYPHTLQSRIRDIARIRDRISFVEGDALALMAEPIYSRRTVFFIDPPYTAGGKRAGSRLYTHAQLDHEQLFALAAALPGEFLMTYDNADEIRKLARQFHFDTELVAMKNTHHARMTELLIGRDLNWARS